MDDNEFNCLNLFEVVIGEPNEFDELIGFDIDLLFLVTDSPSSCDIPRKSVSLKKKLR